MVQGHPSCPLVEVGACLGLVEVEEYPDHQAGVVAEEVPCPAGVEGVAVLSCQEEVGEVGALACQVKEVEEEGEEHQCDLVMEEGVELGEKAPGQVRVGVGVEVASLHSGQVGVGRVVEGANQALAREQ